MFRLIALVLCHLLVWSSLATAQDTSKPSRSDTAAPRVEESQPPLYFLKDKDGNLVPVPGFSLEDFKKYYDLKNNLTQPDRRPRYSIQRVSVDAEAGESHAKLTIDIEVVAGQDGWVRVPLHLNRAVLRRTATYKGQGEHLLHFEATGDGYVCWFRSAEGGKHQLTLDMLTPLSSTDDQWRLKLHIPRAATSELKLKVPMAEAVGRVSEDATLLPPTNVPSGGTEFHVLGLGNDFELIWHKPNVRIAEIPAVLVAEGTVLLNIDDRGVDARAILSVKSNGAAFDRFRVRLPLGAELISDSSSDYTVTRIEQPDQTVPQQRVVEVRLAQKTVGPVEVQLIARRQCKVAEPSEWIELAGFEVLGAARQRGHVAVRTTDGWQVLWGPSSGLRRVDRLPEPLQDENVSAGFEYFVQPYSLTAGLVPKKTRIGVEPEYLLLVGADRIRLEATLKYTVRGAKVFALDVALDGWELDEVLPENLLAVDDTAVSDDGMLTIPLLKPTTGRIEVRVRAHRSIPPGTSSLLLSLPEPQVNSPRPAAVVVLPDDNVRLVPNPKATIGLARQPLEPRTELPERQQPPLFYRSDGTKAIFAAEFSVLKQQIAVAVTSRLHLTRQSGKVEQKLAYTISHEPVEVLTLEVPRNLAEANLLKIACNGQSITPVQLPENLESNNDSDNTTAETKAMRVPLPAGCIGLCELTVQWPIQLPKSLLDQPEAMSVPLVMPGDGKLTGNKLYITAAPGICVEPRPDPWVVSSPGKSAGTWELTADRRADRLELDVHLQPVDSSGVTVVERAWIQTWLTKTVRQDRAVFAFTSTGKELQLDIPAGAEPNDVQVTLDGKPLTVPIADCNRLVVPLSNNMNHRRHILELLIHFRRHRTGPGHLVLEIPRLGENVWVRRIYWQLVLPKNEHVVVAPNDFTGEYRLEWNGYFWGRKPLLEQAQLESWVGAENQTPVSAETNRYLFSGLGTEVRCELRTTQRSWIVLGASGAALVVGLMLIYVPVCRRPGTLLTLALALLCVGMLYPEPTLLIAQAAILGLVLTLTAWLLERSVVRRRRSTIVPEISSFILDQGSTKTQILPPAAGKQSSTQTAPIIVPPSISDSDVS